MGATKQTRQAETQGAQAEGAGTGRGTIDLSEFANLPDTSGMDIVDAMLAEHERILAEADDLERMSLDLMARGAAAFDLAAYLKKVRFIREYADAAHHRKEEDVLYSYMLEHLGKVAENLIRHGMLVEHDQTRMCVKQVEDASRTFDADPSDANRLELISWSMEYVHLIRRHVTKENDVVYPFARRSIPAETIAQLSAQAQGYVPHE
jgi:hemerythrin-like domain-containing protein